MSCEKLMRRFKVVFKLIVKQNEPRLQILIKTVVKNDV